MAVIATIAAQEDFIVQMNGDYNVPFDQRVLTAPAESGELIMLGVGMAEGFGIVSTAVVPTALVDGKWPVGTEVRVMVRGNPTTVNARALVGYVPATHDAALAEAGIVVVNK